MACQQAVLRGGLSNITDSMWLVLAFQFWYVADGLYNEPALFTTMDITTDGFGFMLAIGDLTWVPFVYSLQARYLAFHPVELGPMRTAAIVAVNLLGYYIFRDANNEKNEFRNGKNPKSMARFFHPCQMLMLSILDLKFIETKRGTKLLVSGWWGLSQHPNYLSVLCSLLIPFALLMPLAVVTSLWPSHGPFQPSSTPQSPTFTSAISSFFSSTVNTVMMKPAKTSLYYAVHVTLTDVLF
jgi:protein-S-isoprenylcysteine O-methyltransferase Ste14